MACSNDYSIYTFERLLHIDILSLKDVPKVWPSLPLAKVSMAGRPLLYWRWKPRSLRRTHSQVQAVEGLHFTRLNVSPQPLVKTIKGLGLFATFLLGLSVFVLPPPPSPGQTRKARIDPGIGLNLQTSGSHDYVFFCTSLTVQPVGKKSILSGYVAAFFLEREIEHSLRKTLL